MSEHIKNGFKIIGKFRIRKYKAGTKELLSESPWMKNRVVSSSGYGRNLIIRRLGGDTTYGIEIDSGQIGSGSNTPADSDTALQTAILTGIAVQTAEVSNDQLTVSLFMTDAQLANGTYREFGLFIGGRLFARSLISPAYTKASGEDTTVDYVISLAAA